MGQANALLMSSQYEGYPVVWLEALTLGLPIVTTDVSDAKSDIEGKYGIDGVCLSMPTIVGADGIDELIPYELSDEELAELHKSADTLKAVLKDAGV